MSKSSHGFMFKMSRISSDVLFTIEEKMEHAARCKYCHELFHSHVDAVRHVASRHPHRKVAVLILGSNNRVKARIYNLKGFEVDQDRITLDPVTEKIQIQTKDQHQSPVHKLKKINTPTKSVHKQLFPACNEEATQLSNSDTFISDDGGLEDIENLDDTILYSDSDIFRDSDISEEDSNIDSMDIDDVPVIVEPEQLRPVVERLQKLLPAVSEHFESRNRLQEWTSFFELISSGNFDVEHIASQLFWDVIKFHTSPNIYGMRFTKEVKQFWSTGLSLFHSKFIRFMGGYKGLGLVNAGKDRSHVTAIESNVNFVCPNINILKEEMKTNKIDCEKPSIIKSNIEAISAAEEIETKAFKVCIDGKKIAIGYGKKFGEVDLFGHETQPTFTEKRERLEVEMVLLNETQEMLNKWISMDKLYIGDVSAEYRIELKNNFIHIISILTERIKELRLLKVKRSKALEKLMKIAGENWQKSKYTFAISSTKTHLLRVNMSVENALELINRLGFVVALCNNCEKSYAYDSVVNLNKQPNYVCLSEIKSNKDVSIPFNMVKQRTDKWFEIRKTAVATGSTLHKAAGLSTLKEQQIHFNKVNGLSNEPVNEVNVSEAMIHGVENEINAIGVLVGKVLPIFEPEARYFEEGCYKVQKADGDETVIIVSPDGSCRKGNTPIFAVEVKCPLPGKLYTPDVHYKIPEYYICQILSEMKALDSEYLFYLCWSPQSCTVFKAQFDEELWIALFSEIDSIYTSSKTCRLKRKSPNVQILKDKIQKFNETNVKLIGEFPSVRSVPCEHREYAESIETAYKRHAEDTVIGCNEILTTIAHMQETILKTVDCVNESYNILRTPGKEVLVALLSDLDRIVKPGLVHAVPVAYGISGYSLEVEVVRSLLTDIVNVCNTYGINVRVLSSDGQFYKLSVRDKEGKPLTILQLVKDTWNTARQMPKGGQIRKLMLQNRPASTGDIDWSRAQIENTDGTIDYYGPLIIHGIKSAAWKRFINPVNLSTLVKGKSGETKNISDDSNDLSDLPADVLNITDIRDINESEDSNIIQETGCLTQVGRNDDQQDYEHVDEQNTRVIDEENTALNDDNIFEESNMEKAEISLNSSEGGIIIDTNTVDAIICALKRCDENRKMKKWVGMNKDTLMKTLSAEPEKVFKKYTRDELIACIDLMKNCIDLSHLVNDLHSATKLQLVNIISMNFGNKTNLTTKKSPQKLRAILKDYLSRKLCKDGLNAVIATDTFINETLPAWRRNSPFQDNVYIGSDLQPYVWYSQPEFFPTVGHYILYLLDCHHIFVNARCFVVQNGIPGLNINKKAWLDVAEGNTTELSIAMVTDIIDRQSNAIAQVTFSESVENEMTILGWKNEAEFCRLIRNWYKAEDEPGLDVMTRHAYRMDMRNFLLGSNNLATFPPPGSHVMGMPIVMYEGILTNIDRRIQLYEMTPNKSYNVRAPNTLDAENLFSGFKDIDPKSSGALMADDIPIAMESACYIMQMRLDPSRKFNINTSKRVAVYPCNVLEERTSRDVSKIFTTEQDYPNLKQIVMRNHPFDQLQRKRRPKRKSSRIPGVDEPAKGTQPIREHHRVDCSKILPHVRYGLFEI